MHAIAVLVYIAKLKRGLALAVDAHFLHDFSIKMFLIWYSYNGQSSNVTPYFLRKISKCVIRLLLPQLMMSWILRFFLDQPLKEWLTGRKRGKDKNTKTWISRERKDLFRWNKKHLPLFKGYNLVKKWKYVDVSFNHKILMTQS